MKAEVADVSKSMVTLKYAGEHERCETLLDLLRPYGIREIARTGVIALERGKPRILQVKKVAGPRTSHLFFVLRG